MKQAIQIGAGNIGRGFIGALLSQAGWHVTFADVVEPIIEALNRDHAYTVHILDKEPGEIAISDVDGVISTSPEFARRVAQCDLITTAVGPNVLPIIAKSIAGGIQARKAAGNTSAMNVVCCENGLRTTTRLKNEVLKHLDPDGIAFLEANIGFADCAVDRICPKPSFDNILDAAVERYCEWDVEAAAWKGEKPDIDGLTFAEDLMAYLERKLFTLNSGHAICAYLGYLKGYGTIRDSIADPAIGQIVHAAISESGEGLIKEFGFDPDAHHAYVEKIFARYQNPFLEDEVLRVGREPIRKLEPGDRLIKPLTTAAAYGLPVDHLIFGAAAALRFDCAEDPQSVELQGKIEAEGAAAALAAYSGLKPGDPLFGRILDVYTALALVKR
ncbi:mannitol-1-phosphate 5-dehydrogenase [uncultured Oscillibacter sp.]|uniref:mannitol-1-phosphate 5-dehydrogenase n=1 Tax=uncultured Oscillibacter sp. TaxID=876091 RepID=UPI0025DD7140|nr:mannitol-1-phosphate 5-dehydrogenase [uncultured Oscillibacter sp.]